MAEILTVRETIEYDIEVATGYDDDPGFDSDRSEAISVRSVSKEILRRRHIPDFVIGVDSDRGLYWLSQDGTEVFAHRSHDAVCEKYKELASEPGYAYFPFGDIDDPDKYWRTLG
ncbi:hypothetical protein [Sinomonas notoginsengisoli]|uniref:hypothetical protein n=1 Tax=Sinomonas notoginsengisoli TaxID=1457311 RepID=UPI001F257DAE|nr:hypothetical protein [Sinomonas notoginsengisoli]